MLCCGHQSVSPQVDLVTLMLPGSAGVCQVTPVYNHAAPSEGSVLSEETLQGCADLQPCHPYNCHCTLTPPVSIGVVCCHTFSIISCLSYKKSFAFSLMSSFSSVHHARGLADSCCSQWVVINPLVISRWSVEASSSCSLYPFEMSPHSSGVPFLLAQGLQAPRQQLVQSPGSFQGSAYAYVRVHVCEHVCMLSVVCVPASAYV